MREFLVLMAGKYLLENIGEKELKELESLYEIWMSEFLSEEELSKRVEAWLVRYDIRDCSDDPCGWELDW